MRAVATRWPDPAVKKLALYGLGRLTRFMNVGVARRYELAHASMIQIGGRHGPYACADSGCCLRQFLCFLRALLLTRETAMFRAASAGRNTIGAASSSEAMLLGRSPKSIGPSPHLQRVRITTKGLSAVAFTQRSSVNGIARWPGSKSPLRRLILNPPAPRWQHGHFILLQCKRSAYHSGQTRVRPRPVAGLCQSRIRDR